LQLSGAIARIIIMLQDKPKINGEQKKKRKTTRGKENRSGKNFLEELSSWITQKILKRKVLR